MTRAAHPCAGLLILTPLFLALPQATGGGNEAGRTKEGLAAFRKYLGQKHPSKKWQTGPSRLDAPAVRAAYGTQRFYFVFSRPPLPPGANLEGGQEAHQQRLKEFSQTHISVTARVDDQDRVVPLLRAADFNTGLMKVADEQDARTAAAAILSLYGHDQVPPGEVSPREVTVTRTDKGWSCQVQRRNAYQGDVTLDANGKCTAVSKVYAGPLPS